MVSSHFQALPLNKRFREVDGARVTGNMLVRFVTTPYIQRGAVAALFLTAGVKACVPVLQKLDNAETGVGLAITFMLMTPLLMAHTMIFGSSLPVPEGSVLDLSGAAQGNEAAAVAMRRRYKQEGWFGLLFPLAVGGFFAAFGYKNIGIVVAAPELAMGLSMASWSFRANRQLRRRKWTLRVDRPGL